MQEKMTLPEAWAHFWQHFIAPVWDTLPEKQKNPLRNARRTAAGLVLRKRSDGSTRSVTLGSKRMREFMERYAPGHYEFSEVVSFVE